MRRNNFFGVLKISGITFNYCRKNVERFLDARFPGTLLFRITKAIDAKQVDFQSHRITVRLLYRLKLCCQEVERNKQKRAVICIDFEKAFDSVWINGLLKKLHQSGVKTPETDRRHSQKPTPEHTNWKREHRLLRYKD